MEIVISGYGKMGREIESVSKARGYPIVGIINDARCLSGTIKPNAVCIDFSQPDAFKKNYKLIAENFKAAVVGTTNWFDIIDDVKSYFESINKTLIYATNFSIGVNIFFKINELSARLIKGISDYEMFISEHHHSQKLDTPSGTAKTLGKILGEIFNKEIDIKSVRCGTVPGIHKTGYESEVDRIQLKHEAFSRKGFAEGAVKAAEWTENLKGVFEFREILESKFNQILK